MCVCVRLHTFRDVPHFRMLVCGGDGTVGWVLGVLETVRHKLACSEPAIGIVPLGTGTRPLWRAGAAVYFYVKWRWMPVKPRCVSDRV